MSHSAELSRRMAQARIVAARQVRQSDLTVALEQPPELRRIPWQSAPMLPRVIDWHAVGSGMVVVACLLGAAMLMMGVIP